MAGATLMQLLRRPTDLQTRGRKVSLAIGVFDGVHLGHQQVLRQAINDARQHEALAVAITFDRHPAAIVAPAHNPPLIYSLPQKIRAIAGVGMDAALLIEFTKEFSQNSGEKFIRELASGFGAIHSICVGAEFIFGHQKSGNVELLRKLGRELHFNTHGLAALALDGKTVSSTRIRNCIRAGDLDAATQMLGRAYSICGAVIRGDQVGRTIGVPTANIDITNLVLPPNGVYAVHAQIAGKIGAQLWRGAANLGLRPTIQNAAPQLRFEVHIFDFEGELYGEKLEITFAEKLRDEKKFESLDALKAQIAEDIAAARAVFE